MQVGKPNCIGNHPVEDPLHPDMLQQQMFSSGCMPKHVHSLLIRIYQHLFENIFLKSHLQLHWSFNHKSGSEEFLFWNQVFSPTPVPRANLLEQAPSSVGCRLHQFKSWGEGMCMVTGVHEWYMYSIVVLLWAVLPRCCKVVPKANRNKWH